MSTADKLIQYGKTKLKGRLDKIRQIQTQDNTPLFENVITQPAPSEFDHPQSFPVMSRQHLGNLKEMIEVDCEIQTRRNNGYLNCSLWAQV